MIIHSSNRYREPAPEVQEVGRRRGSLVERMSQGLINHGDALDMYDQRFPIITDHGMPENVAMAMTREMMVEVLASYNIAASDFTIANIIQA